MNYRHARNSHARLLDRYAALFETAAVATLKRVDVACIALRLCAVQAHLRQAIRTQKQRFYALRFVHGVARLNDYGAG